MMKVGQKMILAAVLLGGTAAVRPSAAESSTIPKAAVGGSFDGRLNELGRKLNLTAGQKAQLQAIHADVERQGSALRADGSLTGPQKEDRLKALFGGVEARIAGVLDADQIQQVREMGGVMAVFTGRVPGPGPEGAFAALEKLGLSADQKTRIESIMNSTRQKGSAIERDATLTPEGREAGARALHQAAEQQVMAILSNGQRAMLAALRNFQLRPGGPFEAGGIALLQQVGLSDDQKARIKAIMLSAGQQSSAIESDSTSPLDARRTQIQAIHRDAENQVRALLTDDQRAKLADLMKAAAESSAAREQAAREQAAEKRAAEGRGDK